MDRPKNAATAKWGAACSSCALAKAKCLRSSNVPGAKCDRCERLEKDCAGQVHKPRKKRQARPSKTAQLEERLNSLVDFIKTNHAGEVPIPLRRTSEVGPTRSHSRGSEEAVPHQNERQGSINAQAQAPSLGDEPTDAIPGSYNQHAPRICACRTQAGGSPILPESDDALLSTFVNGLVPNYPFVILPSGLTSTDLIVKHPFLFATIRMVASYRNISSMRYQNYFLMRHISEQMLMRSERSLEMLQSILLILGYYHYHCMMHAQMNNLIALANSLVADLGINKPPETQEKVRTLLSAPESLINRTNDERRALCGVWYMTSIASFAFQRIEPPKYTAYIDQCLKELEADLEHETDLLLVHLVRIQHLSERIAQLHAKDYDANDPAGVARAPVSAYSGVFHAELERFKASLPQRLRSNKLMTCHINTALLRLWEPPRIDATLLEKISDSLASLSLDSSSSSLDTFYRSGSALKCWFEYWLSIEVADYFVLPMPVSAQLINAVIMLTRWYKLLSPEPNFTPGSATAMGSAAPQIVRNDPSCGGAALVSAAAIRAKDIDPAIPAAVRTIRSHLLSQPELQIDAPSILQAMVTRFEEAREASEKRDGAVWDNDIWKVAAKKLRGTRTKLERWAEMVAAVGSENYKPEPPSDTGIAGGGQCTSSYSVGGSWHIPSGVDAPTQPLLAAWDPGAWGANDFFEGWGMDQNFFDSPGDYGAVVMNGFELPGD